MNIHGYSIDALETLSQEIRGRILEVVSRNGGHLSSPLGATEIIVAMHKVFDPNKDPFIFDVSHQAYAHKLLTDRWEAFDSLRQAGGISGYTKPSESSYDYFVSGHSSTSISLGVGAAKAIALKGEDRIPIVLIGDGAMSAGMAYEALDELGDRKYPMVIILNDNEMSIAKPIGALSRVLSSAMASPFYQRFKKRTEQFLDHFGEGAHYLARRFEESLKLITPGIFFEELGIEYIGPIQGHNLKSLIETLETARMMGKPVLVHVQTIKGKGYEIAEGKQEKWHGVSPFDLNSGRANTKSASKSATQIFSEALMDLARENTRIVGVTAAMPSGTGMQPLIEAYPERFWDVAIAEQHAITSMAALAKEGFKPFCAIYSTFLQRGLDQVIHDVGLMKLPVVFAIDRAGIVGEDGETHQGAFDVSFLRLIPHMCVCASYDEASFRALMRFVAQYEGPSAIRYPRGAFLMEEGRFVPQPYRLGVGAILQEGESDVALIGYGNGVGRAYLSAQYLTQTPAIVDLRFVKPLDTLLLRQLAQRYRRWYVLSDSSYQGGVASAILEWMSEDGIDGIDLVSFEYPDTFIQHGATPLIEESLGLLPVQIAARIEA